MQIDDLFPHLNDKAPTMHCRVLRRPDLPDVLHPVPVEHRRLGTGGSRAPRLLAGLPDLPTFLQLRCALQEGSLGLFAARALPLNRGDAHEQQAALGAVILTSPLGWAKAAEEFAEWQFDGLEATFRGLPYKFTDLLFFARLNFSPDRWFTVLRGPMAGKIYWWSHDGQSQMETPWADDLRGWGERLWREVPSLFGGIIRYRGKDSTDELPADCELFPERYSDG
jgi:hypothetical protein